MLEDVTFPVDVVYTWVDGVDPAWRERMRRARRGRDGRGVPPAVGRRRTASRAATSSATRCAPWRCTRRGSATSTSSPTEQRPSWLDPDHPWITLVDHRDSSGPLRAAGVQLQRHHQPAAPHPRSSRALPLPERRHVLRPRRPSRGLLPRPAGSPGSSRPGSPGRSAPAPRRRAARQHQPRTSAAARGPLRVTITRAIRHTPYPQLRSVSASSRSCSPTTSPARPRHRFRHHDDVAADQLLHYYPQATGGRRVLDLLRLRQRRGRASAGPAAAAARQPRPRGLLPERRPATRFRPGAARDVKAFLDAYFPVASTWERADGDAGSVPSSE